MQFYPLLSLQRCQFNEFVAITCLIFGVRHRHCIFPSWCPFENLDPAALTETHLAAELHWSMYRLVVSSLILFNFSLITNVGDKDHRGVFFR